MPLGLEAQITHELNDYRSIASGDYSNAAVWQIWDGGNWVASTVKPNRNNNIFIDQSHEMRLVGNEEAKNVYLFSAANPGRKLNLDTFELQIYGALRALNKTGEIFFINTVANASTDWIYPETGKIVFKGTSRIVVDRASWSANTTNSRFIVVFDPDPSATLIVNSAIKANSFIIQSGTVIQTVNTIGLPACSTFSFNDQSIFNGSSPYGSLVIEPGATLQSDCFASTAQIIRRTVTIPAALFHLKSAANLFLTGNDPTMDAAEFRFEGNVYYSSTTGNQRLVRTTFAASGNPKTYNNILFQNNSSKLLPDSLFVSGDFVRLNGGSIVEQPTYMRFQGSASSQVVGVDLDLQQIEVDKSGGSLTFISDVRSKTNFIMKSGQVDFSGFDLYVNTAGGGSLSYQGGRWLNLREMFYQQIPTTLTAANATFPFEDLYLGGIRKVQLLGNSPGGNISVRYIEIPSSNNDPMYNDLDGTPILYQLNSYFEFSAASSVSGNLEMRISADSLIVDDIDDLRITGIGSPAPGVHLPGLDPNEMWARREIPFGELDGNAFTVGSFRLLSILPVTWLDVSAKWNQNAIDVQWTTAKESGNQNFYIHRSLDGADNFEIVGEVPSKGDSQQIQDYRFSFFEKPSLRKAFFQIEQRDYDGKKSFSKVFKLEGKPDFISEQKVSIWPNPYQNGPIQFELPDGINPDQVSVSVSDVKGQSFFLGKFDDHELQGFLERLNPGIYLIELLTNDKAYIVKLIKK